ncbi:MAG: ferredoxin-NADPH reductase [Mycetocola sp.]
MRRISHEAIAGIIGVVGLAMIVNLLVLLTALPLVFLLITTDPVLSWPLIAVAAVLASPAVTAAFRAFREHSAGGLSPARAYLAGLRSGWKKSMLIGALVVAATVVVLVDVSLFARSDVAVITVPLLGVVAVLTAAIGMLSLVALSEVPTARLRDVLAASAVLAVRRWYITAVSLLVVGIQAALFTQLPAIGVGITASAALYLVWANSRFALRPVLRLDEVTA